MGLTLYYKGIFHETNDTEADPLTSRINITCMQCSRIILAQLQF
jgi:hypothetical protein